jgi:hypothetical protein
LHHQIKKNQTAFDLETFRNQRHEPSLRD